MLVTNFSGGGNFNGGDNGVDLVSASEIPILPVIWLWKFWLARRKLHLLAGPPATGKTTLALAVAAIITNGGTALGTWPDGSASPVGTVVIWSCEDGIEDTVMPRLVAAGADLRRVLVLYGGKERGRRRPFDFERDMQDLEAEVRERGDVVLVIIDSIAHAVPASNNNSRVRKALGPLVEFAERTGCAILGLTHVNKGSKKKDPLDRVNGSVAIGALARLAWVVARDESDSVDDGVSRSVLVRAKSNLGPTDGGFAYHIDQIDVSTPQAGVMQSSRIGWDGLLQGSPKDILSDAEGGSAPVREDRKQATTAFLAIQLAGGPVPTEIIAGAAREARLSWATVRRAADEMGVNKFRPLGAHHWCWSLNSNASVWQGQRGLVNGPGLTGMPAFVPPMPNPMYPPGNGYNPIGGYLPPQSPWTSHPPLQELPMPMDGAYPMSANGAQVEQDEQDEQAGQVVPAKGEPILCSHSDYLIAECRKEISRAPERDGEGFDTFQRRIVGPVLSLFEEFTDLDRQALSALEDKLLRGNFWFGF
jgi:hypothetical protein